MKSILDILKNKEIVTFTSNKTNTSFTYKIEKSNNPSVYWVSVLAPTQYAVLGAIKKSENFSVLNRTKTTKFGETSNYWKVFQWVLDAIKDNKPTPNLSIDLESDCEYCGTKLIKPEEIHSKVCNSCLNKFFFIKINNAKNEYLILDNDFRIVKNGIVYRNDDYTKILQDFIKNHINFKEYICNSDFDFAMEIYFDRNNIKILNKTMFEHWIQKYTGSEVSEISFTENEYNKYKDLNEIFI